MAESQHSVAVMLSCSVVNFVWFMMDEKLFIDLQRVHNPCPAVWGFLVSYLTHRWRLSTSLSRPTKGSLPAPNVQQIWLQDRSPMLQSRHTSTPFVYYLFTFAI